MKVKEAIKEIEYLIGDGVVLEHIVVDLPKESIEALKVGIAALKKQIPKRPLIWENKNYDSLVPNDDWGYECPWCGNQDIDYPEHHCVCGQALNWEE